MTTNEKIVKLLAAKGLCSINASKKDVKIPAEMYEVLQIFLLEVLTLVEPKTELWELGCALSECVCLKLKAEKARENFAVSAEK